MSETQEAQISRHDARDDARRIQRVALQIQEELANLDTVCKPCVVFKLAQIRGFVEKIERDYIDFKPDDRPNPLR